MKRLERLSPERANFYFCIGEMDPGALRRSSDGVVRQHMVVADDVGTKAPFAAWDAMFAMGFPEPTFRIETSPGNQTWGWVLAEPVERSDLADWVALGLLRAWMGEKGLTDPGVADAARYIRLPLGWNSKPKYVPEGGEPPPVKLVEWVPGRRVSLDDMGEALLGKGWRMQPVPASMMNPSLLPTSGAGALVRTADMNRPEPIIRLAQELGLGPKQVRPGVVEAICPNVAEHTADGREATGFSFLGGGLMHCTHGHCQHLRTPDFKAMMVEQYNDQVAVRLALGQDVDPKVQDAEDFLLQASLEYHGALSDTDEVVIEAERMAAASISASKKAATKGREVKNYEEAAERMLQNGAQLIVDETGIVWMRDQGRLMNVSAKDRRIFQLARKHGVNLTGTAANSLIETLLNLVDYDGPRFKISYRQAQDVKASNPAIYVNRMSDGQGIRITPKGWVECPITDFEVLMADRPGGLALPSPAPCVCADELMPFLAEHIPLVSWPSNPSPTSKAVRQRAVLLAVLVSAFWRPGTVPHLMLSAQQGSGKTVTAKRLIALTDPDAVAISSSLPGKVSDLFAAAGSRTILTLDNASGISRETSDGLCALASGDSHAGRKLYTNGERAIMSAKASVIFTTVLSDIVRLPDLLQRVLRLDLDAIPNGARKSERELDAAWEDAYPNILGALFSALSAMLRELPAVEADVQSGKLVAPRLQDTAIAAEAAARGMGWPHGLCMGALVGGQTEAASRLLEANPVAARIRAVIQSGGTNGVWEGLVADLERAVAFLHGENLPPWNQGKLPFQGQYQRLWPDMENAWGVKRSLWRTKSGRGVRLELAPVNVTEAEE